MKVSIEPASAVPPHLLREHLLNYGLPAEIIEWKYFDRCQKEGREGASVWVKDGTVKGMIGMIPFALGRGSETIECAWTCDWFVADAAKHPGIGVLLLKAALEKAGLLLTLGGNEATGRLVPRMAKHVVRDAAVELSVSLRLGGTRTFRRLESRLPASLMRPFAQIQAGRRTVASGRAAVESEAGVSPALMRALASATGDGDGWVPTYDFEHLQWMLGRCPAVESASVYSTGTAPPAAAVVWRPTAGRRWRMALWQAPGAEVQAAAVIDESVRLIDQQGGHAVSTIAARTDVAALALLSAANFQEGELSLPLYVLSAGETPVHDVARLSHLDSDLAYRF
jgi:hypothetical protein